MERDRIGGLFFFEVLSDRSNDAAEDGELQDFEERFENELEKELDGLQMCIRDSRTTVHGSRRNSWTLYWWTS